MVKLGAHNRSQTEGIQLIPSSELIVHEKYDPRIYDNDIGMVKLSRKIKKDSKCCYICT